MAFNLGGFLGGVSEGVTDAIIREEERLDKKLALNNQEASLQRREKNKQRLAKEKLTEELTEKLALYHTEEQVAEIMGMGVNVAQEVFTNSSTAFQNNKDPQALYNWGKTKANEGVGNIDDDVAGITTTSSQDDLTKTVVATGSGFFKPQAPTIKTFNTIDTSLENVYQKMAQAQTAGNTKLLAQLTASKDALLEQRAQAVSDGVLEGTTGSNSYDMAKTNQDKIISTARTRVYNKAKIPTIEGRIQTSYKGNVGKIAAAEIDIAESLTRDWQEGKAPESFVNRIKGIAEDANNAARVAAQERFFDTDEKLRFKSNNPKSNYYGFEINEGEDINNNPEFKKANFRNGDAVVWKTTNPQTGVSRITYTTYSATHNKLYGN